MNHFAQIVFFSQIFDIKYNKDILINAIMIHTAERL